MAVNDVNIRLRAKDETAGAFNSVKGSLSGLKNAVFSVQGAIAGLAGGVLLRGIVQTNRTFQSLEASLITFTGSAEAAAKQFNILQEFAAKTPFSLEEVVGGFNKLVARGINPTIASFGAFGDIASGTGKTLEQFVEAVADAASGEFERLKEFGITASSQGKQVEITFGGVTKTIRKNSTEILGYLEELARTKFGDATARQLETLNGAFSNLGDSVDKLSVAIGNSGLNDFLIRLSKNGASVAGVLTSIVEAMSKGASFTEMFGGKISVFAVELNDAQSSLELWQGRLKRFPENAKIIQETAKAQERLNNALIGFRQQDVSDLMNLPSFDLPKVAKVAPNVDISKEQQKAIDDYNQSIIDAEVHWAGAMTGSERNARNRLKVIEDTKAALDALKVAQTGGFYDPEQRGKRQNSLPAELEAIRESVAASISPLQQYAQSVDNVQASLQNVALSGLKSMEDALVGLVNGTVNAKDAFKSMASSIINDLVRILIQKSITGPLAGAMDGFFSGGGKAIGGSVQSGKPYMVGERGAEMFVPNQSGSIIPSNQMGGGGGTIINQVINVTTGVQQTVRAEIMTLMPQIANAAKSAVADAKLRGGSYASALR